jgi:Fe-S-cluster containining protein
MTNGPVHKTPKKFSEEALIDVDRPSAWKKYRGPAMCEGCWAGCCTMPVEITTADVVRLGLISEDEVAAGSLKRAAARLEREGLLRNYRAGTGLWMLSQKSDRSCVFLGADRRCTVYEKRPDVCRRFPEVGPRPGYCPAGY